MKFSTPTYLALCLMLSGCTGLQDDFYRSRSIYNLQPIVAALDAGEIEFGMKDWASTGGFFIKPVEAFQFGGNPSSKKSFWHTRQGKAQWVSTHYYPYRFRYLRFETPEATYSFYEENRTLFAVFEWNKRSETGNFRFIDDRKMLTYLHAIEDSFLEGRFPINYAVPETVIEPKFRKTSPGTGTIQYKSIPQKEAMQGSAKTKGM